MHTVFAKKMLFFNTEPPCKKSECLYEIKKVKVVSKFCDNFNLGLFYSSLVKACSVVAKLNPIKDPNIVFLRQLKFSGLFVYYWTQLYLISCYVISQK